MIKHCYTALGQIIIVQVITIFPCVQVIVVLTYDVDGNDVAYHSNLYRLALYNK